MAHSHSGFVWPQKTVFLAASLYVVSLMLSHAALPSAHVWVIAAFFSIIMNFTYTTEAYLKRQYLSWEFGIASTLILLSVLGVLVSPVFVIAAIFGHGVWDISKHFGAGIPFFTWYTLSCFIVDFTYGGVLTLYWLQL